MCVIIACEKGKRPTMEQLENGFWSNPDGAGICWSDGKTVHITKGLMTLEDLMFAMDEVDERYAVGDEPPMLVHMRIGTSGGYGAEATHPFPLSTSLEDMHRLDTTCKVAVAHNGVLTKERTDAKLALSDTMSYVMGTLAPLARSLRVVMEGGLAASKTAKQKIAETSVGSRIAVLDRKGRMRLVGKGWVDLGDGVHASNNSCTYGRLSFSKTYKSTKGHGGFGSYGYGYGYGWLDDREEEEYELDLSIWEMDEESRYDQLFEWYGYETLDNEPLGLETRKDGSERWHLPKDGCRGCDSCGSCAITEPECMEIAEWLELNEWHEGDFDMKVQVSA